jgi:hypothetical protein
MLGGAGEFGGDARAGSTDDNIALRTAPSLAYSVKTSLMRGEAISAFVPICEALDSGEDDPNGPPAASEISDGRAFEARFANPPSLFDASAMASVTSYFDKRARLL